MNRGLWAVNEGLLRGVMQPSSRVYRTVVPGPVRRSIKDFTRNITYPGRLLNHVLQGRWGGAGDESQRFLVNTTAGVGGLSEGCTDAALASVRRAPILLAMARTRGAPAAAGGRTLVMPSGGVAR